MEQIPPTYAVVQNHLLWFRSLWVRSSGRVRLSAARMVVGRCRLGCSHLEAHLGWAPQEAHSSGCQRAEFVCSWSVCSDGGSVCLGPLTARWLSSKRERPEQKYLGVSESRDQGASCSLSSPGLGSHALLRLQVLLVLVRPMASPKLLMEFVPVFNSSLKLSSIAPFSGKFPLISHDASTPLHHYVDGATHRHRCTSTFICVFGR